MSVVFPIEESPRFATYTASSGQTVFSVPFPFQDNADVVIQKIAADGTVTTLTESADYSLDGAGDPEGGHFTLTAGASAGVKYRPIGKAVLDRLSSVARNGKYASVTTDNELDRNRIIQQEQRRDIDRAFKAGFGAAGGRIDILPAGHFPAFDADGNMVDGGAAEDIAGAQAAAATAVAAAEALQTAVPNVFPADIAALKAIDTDAHVAALVRATGAQYVFTAGDYSGKADDYTIVEADDTDLSDGAWVLSEAQQRYDAAADRLDTKLLTPLPTGDDVYNNGDELPDAFTDTRAAIYVVDGDDILLCVRTAYSYWKPINDFKPTWFPAGAKMALHFGRKRYWHATLGYGRVETFIKSNSTTTNTYAINSDGVWEKFEDAGSLRITDLGLWAEGNSGAMRNWLRYSTDVSIELGVQVSTITGTLVDGKVITWAGGGSGTYVADQSDLTNRILALRDISGNLSSFSGAFTQADSDAAASLVAATYSGWTRSDVTVTRDATGFDGEANGGCTVEFTAAGGMLFQVVDNSNFSAQLCHVDLGIKRVSGTGAIYVSQDGGATFDALDFGSTGVAWVQNTAAESGSSPTVVIKNETSGDKVEIRWVQLGYEAVKNSLVPTTWASGLGRDTDSLTTDLDDLPNANLFKGSQLAWFMRAVSYNAVTATFAQLDDSTDRDTSVTNPDNSYCWNHAYKEARDGIEVGVTVTKDGAVTAAIDPPNLYTAGDYTNLMWSLKGSTLTHSMDGQSRVTVRPASDIAPLSAMKTIRWGSQEGRIVCLDGAILATVVWDEAPPEAAHDRLTGAATPMRY